MMCGYSDEEFRALTKRLSVDEQISITVHVRSTTTPHVEVQFVDEFDGFVLSNVFSDGFSYLQPCIDSFMIQHGVQRENCSLKWCGHP